MFLDARRANFWAAGTEASIDHRRVLPMRASPTKYRGPRGPRPMLGRGSSAITLRYSSPDGRCVCLQVIAAVLPAVPLVLRIGYSPTQAWQMPHDPQRSLAICCL